MAVSRKTLADLVEVRLQTIANAAYYRAEIPQTPPTISTDDLRVLAYTVLWPSPGAPGDEEAQSGGAQDDLEWRFAVSCVSGLPAQLDVLIDLVDGLFRGWEPIIAGLSVGTCEQDFDPGVPRPDESFTPTRFYLQMPYVLHVGS